MVVVDISGVLGRQMEPIRHWLTSLVFSVAHFSVEPIHGRG